MHVAVVGGGVVGLLSAIECVLAGHRVTLIERGSIPSPTATSYDHHRIVRALHVDDAAATRSAVRAHHRWLELERMLSSRFYDRVGALTVLTRDRLPNAVSALWNSGAQARVLDDGELVEAYPHLALAGPAAVLESGAGVLLADRVLEACAGWLGARAEATLLPRRTVARIEPDVPTVHLTDGTVLRADGVIVAAGPWSRTLVPVEHGDGLRLYRQTLLYCRVPARAVRRWQATPAIPALGGGAWLVPPVAGSPLKLSAASSCREADQVGDHITAEHWRDHLTRVFAGLIPGFDASWVTGARDCYYLADAVTGGRAIFSWGPGTVALTACGGSSFKFAPLLARSLLGLLTDPLAEGDGLPTDLIRL